jgi:hypothetical protein
MPASVADFSALAVIAMLLSIASLADAKRRGIGQK